MGIRFVPIVLVLIFAVVTAHAAPQAASSGKGEHSPKKEKKGPQGTTLDQYRKFSGVSGSRKITLKPITPARGINSGMLVMYGHPIPPPYLIEIDDHHLAINGIQAKPSLIVSHNQTDAAQIGFSPEEKALRRRIGKLRIRAQRIYSDGKKKSGSDPKQEIIDMIRTERDLIRNPEWRGSSLCFNYEGNPIRKCWGFESGPFVASEKAAKNSARIYSEAKIDIERSLKGGATVVCDSSGQHGTAAFSPQDVVEIMQRPGISEDERAELLKDEIFGNYGVALDVIENYSNEEWTAK